MSIENSKTRKWTRWARAGVLGALILGGAAAVGAMGAHGGGLDGAGIRAIHAHHHMMQLLQDLNLDEAQSARVDAVHQLIGEHRAEMETFHSEHLAAFLAKVEAGPLDGQLARQEIDRFLDELRQTAYGVADEAVELVNSLDDEQRQVLIHHLREAQQERSAS